MTPDELARAAAKGDIDAFETLLGLYQNKVYGLALRMCGSEEGQRIQGESGAAIPAYLGQEESWSTVFNSFDYVIDVQVCYDQFDNAVQYINNASRRKWKSTVADEMVKAYSGASDIDSALTRMQEIADSYVTAE